MTFLFMLLLLSSQSNHMVTLRLCSAKSTSSHVFKDLATDGAALLAFKAAITSDPYDSFTYGWSKSERNRNSSSICDWTGVTCGIKHQRVTALNLSGFGLEGTISALPHLGNLSFLSSLDISHNSFTQVLPPEISRLRRLKVIVVAFNSFTGEVPSWLGSLQQIQSINLNHNGFSGGFPLSLIGNNTKQLQILQMGHNFLSGKIPHEIGNFSSLRLLNLSSNYFSGSIPNSIFNMSSITAIRLYNNSLSGALPSDMCNNIPNIKTLVLYTNQLSGHIPPSIHKCSELEILALYDNHFTGDIPSEITSLSMLRILVLQSNYFTGEIPASIGNLSHLELLGLSYASLRGRVPPSIFNISTLQVLDLSANHFTGSLPSTTGLSSFNLEQLYLHDGKLSGKIPNSISNASKLTVLELSGNSFSGTIPDFGNLRFLRVLDLDSNNLTSKFGELSFFDWLANCKYLQELGITSNPLNGVLPASIGNLSTSLKIFDAYESNIKGVVPAELGNLSSLQHVSLSENQLTGTIPTTLGRLKHLQELYLDLNLLQGHIPQSICQISGLGVLSLGYNMLSGPIPECLGEVKSLREIFLKSNKLNSTIPPTLWNLRDLTFLFLSSNFLSGHLSSQIGNLKTMNQLDVSSNLFSGDVPSSIDGCQSLELLSLANNNFEGPIPESLGNLRGLELLDLSNNHLSGMIPKSLQNLRFLESFNVSYNNLEGEIPTGGSFLNLTAQSFIHNNGLCGPIQFQVLPCIEKHKRSRVKNFVLIMKYILAPLAFVLFVVSVTAVLIRRRRIKKLPSNIAETSLGVAWRRVSYQELERGTNNFSEANMIGRGSFGSVFKATLTDGLITAVKVFNLQMEGATKSFDTECEALSTVRHRNLLKTLGCCSNLDFKSLILEYMPNGSLDKWLHSGEYWLDLSQRLNIAIDVALALEYLHHGHPFPIAHCDIKPSNVFLDVDMTARVGDFGIAKLFFEEDVVIQTNTMATIGYMAPEYGSEGKVSPSGDVYSYGIMLLEILTGKRPTDDMFTEEMSLKPWVSQALRNENAITDVLSPGLLAIEDRNFSETVQSVLSMFGLAMECLAISPEERVNMKEVVATLRKINVRPLASNGDARVDFF